MREYVIYGYVVRVWWDATCRVWRATASTNAGIVASVDHSQKDYCLLLIGSELQ